jgi:hypothetical protein
MSGADFLTELKAAGLGSLPGTAAEILDDEVRTIICPDKVTTAQWLDVIAAAHRVGLRTTATIMFGHVDAPRHWARHLLRVRRLQAETRGFTEFVPLPFVPMEAPMQLRGQSRFGPTFREAVPCTRGGAVGAPPADPQHSDLMGEDGPQGAAACLQAGANDLGGTLMNESITRRRRHARPGDAAGSDGGPDPLDWARAMAAHDIGQVAPQDRPLVQRGFAGDADRHAGTRLEITTGQLAGLNTDRLSSIASNATRTGKPTSSFALSTSTTLLSMIGPSSSSMSATSGTLPSQAG